MFDDQDAIVDIVESMRRISEYVSETEKEVFLQDHRTQDAVIRRFEIIGEAAKRLSKSFRDRHSDLPWNEMAGMRDRVIHGYDSVDLEIVWRTATEQLPELTIQIAKTIDK